MKKLYRLLRYDWPLHFVLLFVNWLPDNIIFLRLRGWLARFFIGQCGANLRLGRSVIFYNPSRIVIGRDVQVAQGAWFMASENITIEDEVLIGPFTVLVSGKHTKKNGSYRWSEPTYLPITIGFGSWLGSHVTVVGGVTIGRGVLVGANSVVTCSVPDDSVVGGVPARQLKKGDVAQ